ncbi:Reactivating factor of Adenosylcobalamin-dependent ethanolamine ammonia lyase [Acetitomaculum ruminis DSM 5522]|uniref:Reactivating factor of Adenosylcobalamin-dependent ethanolamine ammonia lyase n=1 Tax=Acetitomaculum ruminis DSM 5522 TaxID=1120918 RepID=A0A1I0ZTI8_9FIRM|nr:ethanolamine ammonia-lyase reactivating factor EutA [Acetitomaculum ruminis]SFB29024.1 Reactivating factor of Adenosylcobalamin-dependent ethanolamine ammonia lyase [Acetitomaculum ruminis DSM 5522]
MQETILSAGIDIGTSTTQLIFSRITIENLASSYNVPRVSIIDKEVIYRSNIYFTPLKSQREIDSEKVAGIIIDEYKRAGISPSDLKTGAVIITGETARKENADVVLSSLSNMAGDFVVATAGPDLESVLSAKGAGADVLSEENREVVANVDIGGGTSNIAFFYKGILKGVCCLDIGGRLIKIENNKISYIFPSIKELANNHGISINVGDRADEAVLSKVCDLMADQLAMALHFSKPDDFHRKLYTNDGKPLPDEPKIQAITYSGGVADCIYSPENKETFMYGDIGVLLGRAVKRHSVLSNLKTYVAKETIRATVVGAGSHTTNVSGSTISYDRKKLPIKNIPVLKVGRDEEMNAGAFEKAITSKIELYKPEGELEQVAIAFSGEFHTGFKEIQELADILIKAGDEIIKGAYPLIVLVENDIAKALGNALNVKLERKKEVICIDCIYASDGDYIDIGEPLSEGRVVPVVTKTLIFNR